MNIDQVVQQSRMLYVLKRAKQNWLGEDDAFGDAGITRLSAVVHELGKKGVHIEPVERFFGAKKETLYFIPVHPPALIRSILTALRRRRSFYESYIWELAPGCHPHELGELPMPPGTDHKTEDGREVKRRDQALEMLKAGFVSSVDFKKAAGTFRIQPHVDSLRKEGVLVDDYWVYPKGAHPFKRYHIFSCAVERAQWLLKKDVDEATAKAQWEADVLAAAQREPGVAKPPQVRAQDLPFIRALDAARAELIAGLELKIGGPEKAKLEGAVLEAASKALNAAAIRSAPDVVLKLASRDRPGCAVEPGVSLIQQARDEIEQAFTRQGVLMLREVMAREQLSLAEKLAKQRRAGPEVHAEAERARIFWKHAWVTANRAHAIDLVPIEKTQTLLTRLYPYVALVCHEGVWYEQECEPRVDEATGCLDWHRKWKEVEPPEEVTLDDVLSELRAIAVPA